MSNQQDSNITSDNPLTPDQIRLFKESWNKLAAKLSDVAENFYTRLFELDPSLRSMFDETDMESQNKKFTDTITVVVKGLDQFEMLGPAIGELGSRHAGYGVNNEHYALVGKALLDAVETQSDEFTNETRIAWVITYNAVASIMKEGSSGQALTSPGI